MMFSLARAGDAPRRFGILNKHGVPAAALALSTLGIALAAVLNTLYPDRAFVLMLSISIFGAMFTWLMIFITHFYFRRQHDASALAFRMRGFPYTTLTGALLMFAMLITTLFVPGFQMTLLYGVPFVAILSIVFLLRVRRVPTQVPAKPERLIHE